jgi:preprotein translocase subunit YajC
MMMNDMQIEARHIQRGDRVTTDNGRVMRVTSVNNGIYRGHLSLGLSDGTYAEVPRAALVQIDRPVHDA